MSSWTFKTGDVEIVNNGQAIVLVIPIVLIVPVRSIMKARKKCLAVSMIEELRVGLSSDQEKVINRTWIVSAPGYIRILMYSSREKKK